MNEYTNISNQKQNFFHEPQFKLSFLHPRQWPVWFFILIIFICTWLPRKVTLRLGAAIGMIFYKVNTKRRSISIKNLELCFPELSHQERLELQKNSYKSYGQNIIDLGYLWWSPLKRLRKNTDFYGFEHFQNAIKEKKPILLLTPHSTGMDQCGVLLSSFHHTSVSMMKEMNNPVLDWIVSKGRNRFKGNGGMFLREAGIKRLVQAMRRYKAMCYYIPDEDFGAEKSLFVPFFDIPAATIPMLGRMAKLSNAVVLPTAAVIGDDGRHKVYVLPPFQDYPSGDDYQDTLKMNQALEELIRICPKQYMWTMKWFKTRPNGEPSPYEY